MVGEGSGREGLVTGTLAERLVMGRLVVERGRGRLGAEKFNYRVRKGKRGMVCGYVRVRVDPEMHFVSPETL